MNKYKGLVLFAVFLVILTLALTRFLNTQPQPHNRELVPISLALDWTPNTNHTGIYVALSKKWYEEEGVELSLLPYGSVSPDVLVYADSADLGISSAESVTASAAVGAPVVSIAAILAHNTSALAVRKDSGITHPSELDGKIYGGYGASFEEPVIRTIIQNDGGKGEFKNVTLNVDAPEALMSKRVDFAWIFLGWQGIQAKREGLPLTTFAIGDYGIPDYYTPVLITSRATLENKKDTLKKFMRATARGYEYARTHPKESAEILINEAQQGTFPDPGLVFESQEYLSPRYANSRKQWGIQEKSAWQNYPSFMIENGSIFDASGKPISELDFDALYTNELFN